MKEKVQYLLMLIIYVTLIIILSFLPNVGFIKVNYLTISVVSVLVIIASIKDGYLAGAICGLTFGLCSYFVAKDYAMNPIDAINKNIIIAILPRVFLGLSARYVHLWFYKIFKLRWLSTMVSSIICFEVMTAFIFLFSYLFEWEILVSIYHETNPLYLFFQYIQVTNLIEVSVITFVTGLLTLIYEYMFLKRD